MKTRAAPLWFWLVPLALGFVQWQITSAGLHQIRYEELAESVRNVYWLDHGLVYDGMSSNVGWYGTLLLVYKLFGFSLVKAKYVRLVIAVAGLYAAADLLRRSFGSTKALVPLAVLGLSPTILYFTSLQTSFGIDIPYAAIAVWMIARAPDVHTAWIGDALAAGAGLVAMIATMSYPSVLLYLPSFVVIAVWRGWRIRHAVAMAAGLAAPLAAAALVVHTRNLLIFDPVTQAGLFRGGGHFGFNVTAIGQSLGALVTDLFVGGQSYYFEVSQPEFSGVVSMLGLAAVAAGVVLVWMKRAAPRILVLATLLLLVLSVLGPALSVGGPPGLRRDTGVIAAFVVCFALAWRGFLTMDVAPWVKRVGLAACLLVPIGSALKMPALSADLAADSAFRNVDWFSQAATPDESLNALLSQLDGSHPLSCPTDQAGRIIPCRLQEIYAALAGSRRWNRGLNTPIPAIDWKTGNELALTPSLWATYYYPH